MTIQLRNSEVTRRGLMVGAAGLTFAVASGLRFAEAQTARGTERGVKPMGDDLDRRYGGDHVAGGRDGAGVAHFAALDPCRGA